MVSVVQRYGLDSNWENREYTNQGVGGTRSLAGALHFTVTLFLVGPATLGAEHKVVLPNPATAQADACLSPPLSLFNRSCWSCARKQFPGSP